MTCSWTRRSRTRLTPTFKIHLLKERIILYLKGVCMGAADVVPGVSGGTIAFITGIYEELLETISGIRFSLFRTWQKEGFKAMWRELNGNFLLVLFAGILTSVASLAIGIKHLLAHYPIQLWGFFFGLIIASVYLVGKQVSDKTKVVNWIGLAVGTVVAYYITLATPTEGSENLIYIFFCGTIAITAMILPGISGSFILLLLGAYTTVLGSISGLVEALKNLAWDTAIQNTILLSVFTAGCVVGILSFSGVLNWMFKKAYDLTVAVLTGFLIGSLNKVWPWKETVETFVKHPGTAKESVIPVVQNNVMPATFEQITGGPSHMIMAVSSGVIGLLLIVVLDRFATRKKS